MLKSVVNRVLSSLLTALRNAILGQIPLPRDGVEPRESCVSWTKEAIARLQDRQWVDSFDIEQFMVRFLERPNAVGGTALDD